METIYFLVVSVLLIAVVLLQQKSAGLGSLGGSDSGDELVATRRGADQVLHRLTILLSVLLIGGGLYLMLG